MVRTKFEDPRSKWKNVYTFCHPIKINKFKIPHKHFLFFNSTAHAPLKAVQRHQFGSAQVMSLNALLFITKPILNSFIFVNKFHSQKLFLQFDLPNWVNNNNNNHFGVIVSHKMFYKQIFKVYAIKCFSSVEFRLLIFYF